jgi:hypothetical protein
MGSEKPSLAELDMGMLDRQAFGKRNGSASLQEQRQFR